MTFPQFIGAFILVLVVAFGIVLVMKSLKPSQELNNCKPTYGDCMTAEDCKDIGQEYPGKECEEERHVCCSTSENIAGVAEEPEEPEEEETEEDAQKFNNEGDQNA